VELPRLKAHFTASVVDDSKVFLVAENQHYLVQGAGPVAVLPYLDGRHTVAEIAMRLSSTLSVPDVLFAIRKYEASGQLVDGRPDLPDAALAYWDAAGLDVFAVAERLRDTELTLLALGGSDSGGGGSAVIVPALRELGLAVRESTLAEELAGGAGGVSVVVVDDYLHPDLAALNEAYIAAGRPWVLAKARGTVVWAGPLIQSPGTGCWACLEQRVSGNRQVEQYLRGRGRPERVDTGRATLTSNAHLLAGLLGAELAHLVATGSAPNLTGRLLTLDTRTLRGAEHTLVRQPQCPACGDPTIVTQRSPKVVLTPTPVRFDADGGFRVQPPEETLARLEHHISPYLGAVSSLGLLGGEPNGVTFSYTAGHNFAMMGDNIGLLRRNLRGQSGGKGRTDVQARVSAVCEAIERYTGVWRGAEPVTTAAYDELGPREAVHPADLLGFSAAQFAGRHAWNADPLHRLHLVPEPFRTDLPVDWTSGWSLTHGEERKVPSAIAWFGHPDLDRHFYCVGDSNGGASGNTVEEAIVQGFCEVVERDAVALWWYNRALRPAVDLDSMHDPYVDTLREFYARLGRSLWLLDITTDLGVPSFVGISHRTGQPVEDIIIGFGAHLSPRLAALRALTEVNQFLPAVEQTDATGRTIYKYDDEATLAWWAETTLASDPWLAPDPARPAVDFASFTNLGTGDLAGNVETCVEQARRCGLETIVIDQTRPDLELSVVKVVVPHLRHFWRRLGGGRLYDVPVQLGWLDAAVPEDGVNPKNVFF
jgi:ribosomal protein S12 methylthiotransferase accessory factor